MNYQVPPKPAEPKQRYVLVDDPAEIEAVQRAGPSLYRHQRGRVRRNRLVHWVLD